MRQYLSFFPVLCFLILCYQRASAQENFKNYIGITADGIHTLTKSFNIHQNVMGYTYDLSPGITLFYDRIFKKRFFIRAKAGYYYMVNNTDVPGEFSLIDHSMKRIGQYHVDAFPLGVNLGIVHSINEIWSLNFYLGLSSYLLYRPIPSAYTKDLNEFLRTVDDVQITTRIISGAELYSFDFIHSYEIGHSITYNFSKKYPFSIFMNNYLKVGFKPYINFNMVIFTSGLQGEEALWNAITSNITTLFFSSIGVRYGF